MDATTHPLLQYDWLGACRAAAQALDGILAGSRAGTERIAETGERGEGGDRTLVIDAAAEEAVLAELGRLHDAGARFTVVSEERGTVDFGGEDVVVVVDPIDGSLNAKRGLGPHALSIAVATGGTMADVHVGFVHDYGMGEEWTAVLGQGAWLNGVPLADHPPERRTDEGRLEVVLVEGAAPYWLAQASDGLLEHVHRVRAFGSIAISLCQVAPPRADGMCSLSRSRAVDSAAAQLVVREAGGLVAYPGFDDPLGAPLDLEPHSPVVAARTPDGLARLIEVVS